ncbi:undecaprenyl-diphosphate phosphatase [Candidatus Saccharibacteria bacterium]|nr:undecaprenyl-diphosphate phosphatase [Candidatus Saccharibacteria bacterium]
MPIFESIVLGLVQGLTEFIPVSSSGHLELVEALLSAGSRAENFHLFLEFINLGTLLALLIFYRKKILEILSQIFKKHDFKFAINILLTILPVGIAGLLLSDLIESLPFFSSLATISVAMLVVGLLMYFIDKLPKLSKLKNLDSLPKSRALLIGCAQIFALIPGTSRSGTSILAGRLVGLNSEDAADYSFLSSIPIMTGVCLKMFLKSSSRAYFFANLGTLALSNLVAFLSGLFALYFVLRFLKKPNGLKYFGAYRICLALLVLALVLIS